MSTYCLIHGRAHYPGETDTVASCGDELACREEEWPVVTGVVTEQRTEPMEDDTFTIHANQLCYLWSVTAGLVPVKVKSISEDEAEVRVTASRPGFSRGETFTMHVPNVTLISRAQVYVRRGQFRTMGPARFMTDEGVLL